MLKSILLDNNALIAVEKDEQPTASFISDLIQAHNNRKIEIQIPTSQAAERLEDSTTVSNFNNYLERIKLLGLQDLKTLPHLGYWGLGQWGVGVYYDGKEPN